MPRPMVHGTHGTVSAYDECDMKERCTSPYLSGDQSEEGNANMQFFCSLCKIAVNSPSQLQEHSQGAKHKTILEACSGLGPIKSYPRLCFSSSLSHSTAERVFHCEICNVQVNSEPQLKQHISSRRHREAAAGKSSPHSIRHKNLSSSELMSTVLFSKDLPKSLAYGFFPDHMSVTAVMSDPSSSQLPVCTIGMSQNLYLPIIHITQFNHARLRPAARTIISSYRQLPFSPY
ncbi:zinc finger protein 385A [Astyanax mexicanus]|uniref:zinc finger protein 385A n=1 Tax=Astyanax mexicanus TaxID=7994 RepID=UPI0020CB1A13|nr:zinc finger protein 385A [Astyanax mexicanus]